MRSGSTKILDYTGSQIIAVEVGKAKTQNGSFRLVHVNNIGILKDALKEINTILNEEKTKNLAMSPYLHIEASQIQNLLNEFEIHRNKKAINAISSAWKGIAGSTYHDNFTMIKDKMKNVLENKNKQIIINKIFNDQINNITKITNLILENISSVMN